MKMASALSSKTASKDLQERIPRKRILDDKEYNVMDVVRSIEDRKCDKWTSKSAMDRLEVDYQVFQGLTKFLLSLFKENDKEEESSCSKISIAYVIKSKFDDDDFITSKCINTYHIYTSTYMWFTSYKMADQQEW